MTIYETLTIFLAAIIATSGLLSAVCYAVWFIVKQAVAPLGVEIEQIKNDMVVFKNINIAGNYITKIDCKEIRENCPGRKG